MKKKTKIWPNEKDSCWDCGSIYPGRHTPLCEFADKDDRRDLPQIEGTQWWDKKSKQK